MNAVLKTESLEEAREKQLTQECVCGHQFGHHKPGRSIDLADACTLIGCDCQRFWKLRKVGGSPTERSLSTMHNRRYLCQVVEHWVPVVKIRRDLFGVIDVLCVRGEDIVGVQTTTSSNAAARVSKITESERYPLICDAIRIIVHGWRKNAQGRWVLREIEL